MPDFQKSGFGITLTFSKDSSLKLYCTEVTPPGFDAGDDIDITTNETVGAAERAPADLGAPTDFTATAAEILEDRAKLQAMIGLPQTITIEFKAVKNRSTAQKITFAEAWLRSWTPGTHTRGEMPTIELVFGIAGGTHTGDASNYHPEGSLEALS